MDCQFANIRKITANHFVWMEVIVKLEASTNQPIMHMVTIIKLYALILIRYYTNIYMNIYMVNTYRKVD